MMRHGLVQVYTGDGKGKTTAALGLALRALGWGQQVLVVQFLKDGEFGEVRALRQFPQLTLRQFGTKEFVDLNNPSQEVVQLCRDGWEYAKTQVATQPRDLLILDEMNLVLGAGIVPWEEVEVFLKNRPEALEVVFTGRNAPDRLRNHADLVTEFCEVRHPLQNGVKSRQGIEW